MDFFNEKWTPDKPKIKLVFSDMDGTLLDGDGNLPPDFDATMARLKERGARFSPASGRQYTALVRQMEKYIDDFIFLSENGTTVVAHDRELFSTPITKADALAIIKATKKIKGAYPVLCSQRVAYVEPCWRPHIAAMDVFFTQHEYVPSLEEKLAAADCPDTVKVAIAAAECGDAEFSIYPHLKQFEPELKVILASDYWVDIQRPGVNKGVAALKIAELLGVRPEECAAFGDYLNDLEMVQMVGYGFAMANAHPDVRRAARCLAPPNTEYGVTKMINYLIDNGFI